MFMSSTAPHPQPTSRSSRLRALIDDLILFGQLVIETLHYQPGSITAFRIMHRFGTRSFNAIIARVTRGLMLAEALEMRVRRMAKQIDNPPPPRARPEETRKRAATGKPRAKTLLTDDDRAILARMPTSAEIAANVRNRPICDVLADIARDIGLAETDPLWLRILEEIRQTNSATGLAHLMNPLRKERYAGRRKLREPPSYPDAKPLPAPAQPEPAQPEVATGPPPLPLAA